MTLYFAYGSNLSFDQMKRRCPDATPVGAAVLHGFDFALNRRGHATVVPTAGRSVHGGLWKVTDTCESSLDHYEGVAHGTYRRQLEPVTTSDGIERTALVYVAPAGDGGGAGPAYTATVLEGAGDFELPESWITRLRGVFPA